MSGQSKVDELREWDTPLVTDVQCQRYNMIHALVDKGWEMKNAKTVVDALINAVKAETRERDAEICEIEMVDGGTIWMDACESCAKAIRTQEDK